jgi:hypothetical protein
MCLTCEKNGSGHYKTQGPRSDELDSRSQSRAASPGTSQRGGNNYADDSDDGETAASPGSDDETETGRKYRPFRQVRNNSTKLNFTKRRLKDTFIPQRAPVDDPSAERCITCVDPLTDRYWTPGSGAGWDKFCPR